MPPTQIPQAQSAIGEMEDVLRDILREWRDAFNSDDYKKGKKEARAKVKRLRKKYYNLKKVIAALKRVTIKWGTTGSELGNTDKTTDPPTITLNDTWQGIRDAVMAQILAHEAIHLLSKSKNSVDQEIRCRKKELEVWSLLKGNQNHPLDLPCNNEQKWFALGEKWVRIMIRGLYKGIPEHDVKHKKKPKPKKKRARIKIERARNIMLELWQVFFEFFAALFRVVFAGAMTEDEYTFDVRWPRGYEASESEGHDSLFQGLVGVGPEGGRGFPALISVYEAPDVIHGGDWSSYEEEAEYQVETLTAFNVDVFDDRVEVIRNEACEVSGAPGHCVEVERDIHHPQIEVEDWRTRIREQTVYTQCDGFIYTMALQCEASEWESRVGDFERLVGSFVVRT